MATGHWCFVGGCSENRLSMRKFPAVDDSRFKQWKQKMGRNLMVEGVTDEKLSRQFVCEKHFDQDVSNHLAVPEFFIPSNPFGPKKKRPKDGNALPK